MQRSTLSRNLLFVALIIGANLVFDTCVAQATIYVRPSLMYLYDRDEDNGSKTSTTRQLIDLGIGYIGQARWALGGLYATERKDVKSEPASGGTTTTSGNRTSLGPTLGWVSAGDLGFYILGTYFVQSEYVEGSNTYKGNGYEADLGVRIPVRGTFVALQVSYKNFEYKKYSAGGGDVELSRPRVHTFIDPYFALFFEF